MYLYCWSIVTTEFYQSASTMWKCTIALLIAKLKVKMGCLICNKGIVLLVTFEIQHDLCKGRQLRKTS